MQRSFKEEKPTLFVVSTPIGNLSDMTYRAVETLKNVDLILAEDTRTSGVLLNHYQIKTKMMAYHEFNKSEKESEIIQFLSENKHIALISDAGTPGISDPGYEIIQKAISEGFYVVAIPGASAILAALVTSGLVIQPFTFIGFLPRKNQQADELLMRYQYRTETLVIYESPLRIGKTCERLYQILGNRKISIARELTKTFETIIRTDLKEASTMEHQTKGEYVIIIEGTHESSSFNEETIQDHYLRYIHLGYPDKDAIKQVAKDRKIPKSDVYQQIKIKKDLS